MTLFAAETPRSRGEHTFDSRRLGVVKNNSINNYTLTLDQRFKKIPILIQIIGPELSIMKENSLPFFQQTYSIKNVTGQPL